MKGSLVFFGGMGECNEKDKNFIIRFLARLPQIQIYLINQHNRKSFLASLNTEEFYRRKLQL